MTSTPASAPLAALSSAIPQPFKVAVVMRALVAAIMVPFMLWWSGSGTLLAAFGGDNAIYFLTANYFSPYAEPLAVAGHIAASSSFPPLYPLLLALTGGNNFSTWP